VPAREPYFEMDTNLPMMIRLMSIGNNYELPDDGPGNVVPPRSEVSAQTEVSGSRI
jgi:hypothetical protein